MKSVRSYLLSRLLGGVALALALAGISVYFVVTRSLDDQFDRNLSDRVQGLASLLFQTEDHVEFEFSGELMPEYERQELPAYFELWYADGRLLERSESLEERDLTVHEPLSYAPTHWSAALPDGRPGRYVARLVPVHHVFPEEGPQRPQAATVRIVIARGREDLEAGERMVLFQCTLFSIVLLALIGFIAWKAVERGLEPTHRLAATLDAIEVDHLPECLDVGKLPAELVPVATKTDALIRRLDAALERERRTTADIAHELRTPISEVLTVSEVALRNGHDPEGARKAFRTLRDIAWRMGNSVSTLLKLARLEMGAESFDREEVDLRAVAAEILRSLSALQRERELRVENLVEAGELVDGDREVLRIVVSNLLSNALYYSPRGGLVLCRLERSKRGWRFVVENTALDLQPADLEAMSEPFWRKDRARTDRNRSGLGLALSRALAEKTGLSLDFELEDGTLRAILSRGVALSSGEATGVDEADEALAAEKDARRPT